MKSFVFDVETKGQAIEDVLKFKPDFEAPASYKDPIKIAAAILEKEINWKNELALDPVTGSILVIGIREVGGKDYILLEGEEKDILANFWKTYEESRDHPEAGHGPAQWIGHYIYTFDLSYIIRRCWILDVKVPSYLVDEIRKWQDHGFIDTAKIWQLNGYNKEDKYIKLSVIGEVLGVGIKTGEGKDFAELYKKDRAAAITYLKTDLDLTEGVARRIVPFVY